MSARHPNKEIREAIEYAVSKGWRVKKSGPRSHAWGRIYCGYGHHECAQSVYSTPRNPEGHARLIRRVVDRCPGPEES